MRDGKTRSCGHIRGQHPHDRIDLTGQRFGKLTVIREHSRGRWECQCDCGSIVTTPTTGNLRGGRSRSCRHCGMTGYAHSPTHRSWTSMLRRCRYDNPWYGARGITYDPRWESFENFYADMGERPEGYTLDRIDSDGMYCKDNCRWADPITQANNKSNNKVVEFDGRALTIAQWARETGIPVTNLRNRLRRGWSVERALTT